MANKKPMANRLANHKAHHKAAKTLCQMTDHLMTFHTNENAQDLVKITLLDICLAKEEANIKETQWA